MNGRLLEIIYEKYANEIYLYLVSLCRNSVMAEDLMQEVFLKALLSLSDCHTNFRAWLYVVAKNLCFNEMKKQKQQLAVDELPEMIINDASLEKILKKENQRILYETLLKLPTLQKEILVMQYFSGLSQKEIARILNLTLENVRVLSHRGKRKCRTLMEEMGYEV